MKKCCKDLSLSDPGILNDSGLLAYADIISARLTKALGKEKELKHKGSLRAFADYHKVFGLHFEKDTWVIREWAPNARQIFILCEKTSWQKHPDFELLRKKGGVFEKKFKKPALLKGDLYRLKVVWQDGEGDRIPTAATEVVQDGVSLIFNARVPDPFPPYEWKIKNFSPEKEPLLIYEAHVGMALEEGRVGTYAQFEHHILPKIVDAGYNTLQLMAIQEHPYYGSFGYHVSSFFAPSSRFGTPDEFKSLIDACHREKMGVFMDIIHSHAVKNEVEGLSKFDGTDHQFFHTGPKGWHRQWDSRCFDYGKPRVIHFLLSNARYWIEEFHLDGFRFDGITSMLFADHGLGRAFTGYKDYYGPDVDGDALSYLYLVNCLIHEIKKEAVTIAEDVSGYPGLCAKGSLGGTGFDYRYAMGIADFWIKLLKEYRDEQWHLGTLWYELTARRREEKTISYAESHDQSLVGDKTLFMHLMGKEVYRGMRKDQESVESFRGVALHKMIRLITITTAGSGYLNFMGNEFGHPEWVDFPSKQNNFSFQHARRQWSLKYDKDLFYSDLFQFDKEMIAFVKGTSLLTFPDVTLHYIHEADKIISFRREQWLFVFNFHHSESFSDYSFDVPPGEYHMVFNTDDIRFGGKGRLKENQIHFTSFHPEHAGGPNLISLYLPNRTAMVLKLKPRDEG